MEIRELVARRTDLSTFLVHLTRVHDENTALYNLVSILSNGVIKAKNPFGPAVSRLNAPKSGNATELRRTQMAVSFTETPLEHVYLLLQEIAGRQCQFSPFGVAFTKKIGREMGLNPVWYMDTTPGHEWLTNPLNDIINEEIRDGVFGGSQGRVWKLTPYIDQMGSWDSGRKEFWWEREWRCAGDVKLPDHYIILCPENEMGTLENELGPRLKMPLIDPNWGLEQIIARLARFEPKSINVY